MVKLVNYDEISKVYDVVRQADENLVGLLVHAIDEYAAATVLDIGCGTGTYAKAIQERTQATVAGVEPSPGMLGQARRKAPLVDFRAGDAEHLPLDDETCDLVYMTDVIHHVARIERMFGEIRRVLKPGGKVCIVTQSHAQIAARPIAGFFPATVTVDRARYPEIGAIVAAGEGVGLTCCGTATFGEGESVLDHRFLALVRAKGYSMLHLIDDADYEDGLARLEAALAQGDRVVRRAGQTLVWFRQ